VQTIVIAWVSKEIVSVRERRTDLGEWPQIRVEWVPKAAIWLNSGDRSDLAKARAYAAREGYRVYAYDVGVSEPLRQARADVMRDLNANKFIPRDA
jgi:hypothetical protein